VAVSVSVPSEVVTDRAGAPRRGRRPGRARLIAVALILVAALIFLLVEGLGSSLDYFDTVAQALAHKQTIGTSTIRLEGVVVRGSVEHTATGTDFVISSNDRHVRVDNTGDPPQLFQPGIPVVVVGHFVSASSDRFLSNQIMVKHSADYIAAHPNRVRAPNGSTR